MPSFAAGPRKPPFWALVIEWLVARWVRGRVGGEMAHPVSSVQVRPAR